MGLVASAAMAAAADSQGTLGRASIDGFRTAMLAIAPAESPYAEPHFARDCVLELRRALNSAHRRAGSGVMTTEAMFAVVANVVKPHMSAVATNGSPDYVAATPRERASRWMRALAAALNRTRRRLDSLQS